MVRTTLPSPPMRMKALGTNDASALAAAADAPIERGLTNPISRPPPRAALALRKPRRETSTRSRAISAPRLVVAGAFGRALDALSDAHVGAAAADVPGHRRIDVAVGRVGLGGEQRRRGHDLSRL